MSKIQLYQGDCLELMKDIPDKSINMVLCDLPFGVTDCKWDVVIPFEPLWKQYKRIIKDNGAICLFGSEPFSSYLRLSNIEMYKYDWIWKKRVPTGFQHSKNMPLKNFEIISVFSKGSIGHKNLLKEKRMFYNPQGLKKCCIEENGNRKFKNIIGKRPSHKEKYIRLQCNYPRMIIEFDNQSRECSNNKRLHPTQKPVNLLEYLIKTYTNKGYTVLDNCMGSGSTGVACVNTSRNFIGIELDQHYFQIAKERAEKAGAPNA